jgi:cytochrome P450
MTGSKSESLILASSSVDTQPRGAPLVSTSDFDAVDFFRAGPLYQDPFPYYEYLRERGPVWREPHHGVVMVTGYEEAIEAYHDTAKFSNCNAAAGPFATWPVPLEGDDVSEIIEEHRDELPFSDQLPTFDPPKHTAHRGLLARLITPKRLKENEEFMWRLADRQIDEFLDQGRCEFIHDYARPFTLLVIADLLGVPETEHETFREELQGGGRRKQSLGAAQGGKMAHKPLEFLYERFTNYIEDRRREPRDDVMTGLATATFPDGSLPEVRDVMLIASNLFAAGQETTARLLGKMLQLIGERSDLQQLLRDERDRISNFIEEALRIESPLQNTFVRAATSTRPPTCSAAWSACTWSSPPSAERPGGSGSHARRHRPGSVRGARRLPERGTRDLPCGRSTGRLRARGGDPRATDRGASREGAGRRAPLPESGDHDRRRRHVKRRSGEGGRGSRTDGTIRRWHLVSQPLPGLRP